MASHQVLVMMKSMNSAILSDSDYLRTSILGLSSDQHTSAVTLTVFTSHWLTLRHWNNLTAA